VTHILAMGRISYLANQLEVEFTTTNTKEPIPMDSPSKKWVCDHSLVGIVGSSPVGDIMSVPCDFCLCSQVGVLPTLVSLAEFDPETSKMRRPMPTRAVDV